MELEVSLHDGQLEVYNFLARFKILVCGRRWGKTTLAAYLCIIWSLSHAESTIWVVSPSYSQTKIMWRMIKKKLPQGYVKRIMEGELFIELKNGSTLWAKSGDNPDALRGEGLDGVVIDESAYVNRDVWEQAIRPALADKQGWALFIGTPAGKNWFYEIFLRGVDTSQTEYKSFRFTSYDNPFLDKKELAEMIQSLPEIIYKQEILAEFIEGGGVVFRNIDKVIGNTYSEAKPDHLYVIGVDLGRHADFTVISVGDLTTNEVVYLERFNREDWEYIRERVRAVHNNYNHGTIYIDSTGMGDPIYEELAKEGLMIYGINLNVSSKPMLIENLQLQIENQLIKLPDDKELKVEFSAYTYDLTPAGNIKYHAPAGFHDDIVISIALTAFAMGGGAASCIGAISFQDEESESQRIYDEIPDILHNGWDEE